MPFKTFKYSQEKWQALGAVIYKGNVIALQEEVGLQNQEEENQGKKSGSVFPGLLLLSRKFWGVPEYAQYVFLPFWGEHVLGQQHPSH